MRFSFVIVGRKSTDCAKAIESLGRLQNVDPANYEVLLATGNHPSKQRNEASASAQGEYLIFLDNDSCVAPDLIAEYENALRLHPKAGVVGGPSIYSESDSFFKVAANMVMKSKIGLGPFRARYQSLGGLRSADERDLILCNLLIKRDLFLENEGFRRDLYPNEENELLTRLAAKSEIIYHPRAVCFREPRSNYLSFAKQFFFYGFGRAKHYVFLHPKWNWIFLIPSLFSLYFIILVFILLSLKSHPDLKPVFAAPALLYAIFIVIESVRLSMKERKIYLLGLMLILFWSCHFFYGLGFAAGKLKRQFSFTQ